MDHFELFGIQKNLDFDLAALKKTYFKLSKKYHPDFHTVFDKDKQEVVLQKSVQVNEAYKILTKFDKRLAYFLVLKGVKFDEDATLPQGFLFEMMDVNETIEDLKEENEEEKQSILNEIMAQNEALEAEAKIIFGEKVHNELTKSDIALLKNIYLKRKYLHRIIEQLKS